MRGTVWRSDVGIQHHPVLAEPLVMVVFNRELTKDEIAEVEQITARLVDIVRKKT